MQGDARLNLSVADISKLSPDVKHSVGFLVATIRLKLLNELIHLRADKHKSGGKR